jgi:hypothetical protein
MYGLLDQLWTAAIGAVAAKLITAICSTLGLFSFVVEVHPTSCFGHLVHDGGYDDRTCKLLR